NSADSTTHWPCRLISFAGSLACTFLSPADDALCIRHDRHRQKNENSNNDASHFHVHSPKNSKKPSRVGPSLSMPKSGSAVEALSALPPKADMCSALAHVRFGPIADICRLIRSLRRRAQSQPPVIQAESILQSSG